MKENFQDTLMTKIEIKNLTQNKPNILESIRLEQALRLAKKKSKKGEISESKKIYEDILSRFPKNRKAQHYLVNLFKKLKQSTVNHLINLYNQGQFLETIKYAQSILEKYPEEIKVWNILGAANKGLNRISDAMFAFKKVTQLNPNYAIGHNNLGIVLHKAGKLEKAVEAYNNAITIKPDYFEAYFNMGNALKDQDKLEESIQFYKKVTVLKPDYFEAYYNMGNILKKQDKLEEAIKVYEKVISLKPDYVDVYNNMGCVLYDQGKLKEAIDNFNKALSLKYDFPEAFNNMGIALKDQGKLKEAIEAYNKALSLKPDYAEAYNNLGGSLNDKGMLEEAIEAYIKAISITPYFAQAYNNMGVALKDQGKLEKSIDSFNKALSLKPDYAEAYNNMGVALQDQGKIKEAIDAYNKAIFTKPDYTATHRNLSLIKQYDAEDEHFHQVKELYRIGDLSEDERCNLSFALAKMYEDIGDLNQAFNHLSEGNSLRKKLLNYSIKVDKNQFNSLKKTQPYLLKSSLEIKKCSDKLLPVFIVGMPRSGTTLVEQIISSHTAVTGAGELNYADKYGGKLSINSKSVTKMALSDFRKKYLFELSKVSNGNCIVTDKMPQNFLFIPLICAALPEAKIIHIQRDAAATCWSNYKKYFDSKDLGYCYNLNDLVKYYNLYKDLMRMWQSEYNDRIYNLNYENLTIDQENQSKKLIKHLGLNWEEACLSPEKNKRSVRTASQQQVRKKVYKGSSDIWHKYIPYLNGVFDSLT